MSLGPFQATVVDNAGNAIDQPTVQVWREISGAPAATLYSDFEGVTPLTNPFTVAPGSNGYFRFHTAGGFYRVRASFGAFSREWRYVGIGTGGGTDNPPINWIDAAWSNVTAYNQNDALRHNDATYVVKLAHTNKEPGVAVDWADYWFKLAEDGSDGVIETIAAGENVSVDNTDPANPEVATTPNFTFTEAAAPSTPASGKLVVYAKTDSKLYKKDDAGVETEVGAGGGGSGGGTNYLINGGMQLNQRQATTVADDVYCFDRWYVLAQTGNMTIGAQTLIENGWATAIRMTQGNSDGSSNHRFGLAQIIEAQNCQALRGEQIIFSARVKYSNSANLRIAILEWTGTADSVTSDVVNDWTSGTYTAGNFFLSSNLTVTAVAQAAVTANTAATISVTGTIGSSANNIVVVIWTEATAAQSSTLDIGKCLLERGASVGAFEPTRIDTLINQCQRYYEKTYDVATAPGTATTTGQFQTRSASSSVLLAVGINFKTRKRAAPTVTTYNPDTGTSGQAYDQSAVSNITVTSVNGVSEGGFSSLTQGSSWTDGNIFNVHYVAAAEL